MKLIVFFVLAAALCVHAEEVNETQKKAGVKETEKPADSAANKDKRQTFDEAQPGEVYYRAPRKQEPVAPVEEPNNEDKNTYSRVEEEYRPGQVFSLTGQELLDLQPERKAPLPSSQQLQDLYSSPQQEHKQNIQQLYFIEPQQRHQKVSLQPSHAVISRPSYTSNGGEASVGAALSVSDTGASPSDSFEQELYALLGQAPSREEARPQTYQAPQSYQPQQSYQTQTFQPQTQVYQPQTQTYQPVQASQPPQAQQVAPLQPVTQNIAAQYQQIDRYITKPSKKPTKLRSKVQISPPQSAVAPQQYLIETTSVQQQPQQIQQQPIQQQQTYQQYRQSQPQRPVQLLRYVPFQPTQQAQQIVYDSPEPQGIKVVPAPKLTQPTPPEFKLTRVQPSQQYRFQYQQPEASPKQYRIIDSPRATYRQEHRLSSPSIERPVTYLKRFPDVEKQRAVKVYEQMVGSEGLSAQQQAPQLVGEQQYYLRPMYRINDQRARYEYSPLQLRSLDQPKAVDPTKPPASSIYVSKNIAPKKVIRPTINVKPQVQQSVPQEPPRDTYRIDPQANYEQREYEQSSQYAEQRAHLPPPKNNKAYTPEEFAALVAAGYSVTPIPVGSLSQSRSSAAPEASVPQRRILPSRRNQYLPLRSDEAP